MGTRLQGRVAVITGGCNGIGLATAKKFLDEGAKVVVGDANAEAGAAIAEELGVTFVAVDVTDTDQVEALFRTAFDTHGSVDIAFNNVEVSSLEDESILTTGLDTWRDVHEASLTSVYLCCRAALRYMLEHKHGSIINAASIVAVMGSATSQISYAAAAGGVLSMSRELGVQFARDGIRVNALCHGPVSTPLSQELVDSDPQTAERRLERIPMGRFAEPQEIANAVLFLASDESSFITASQFLVDGGISGAYVTPV
ncbi:3-oxoacyl-ACP reductase [Jatrophihabitans sp.]|jgi:NAD(P)-dependent dehydrogenase (short-subunit alcohol dehydrogenase family)|uniref:3-oxoacyl-ACP reductase n=1 Tax=Jatrophihabitans sp. TaxID=1932789 RepID=UPI002F00DF51